MSDLTFTLRVLTPLFLAGADQGTAELRAPSFRGLMRYWQRALVGGQVGSLDLIKKAEIALFGATDKGSSVSVTVSAPSLAPRQLTEKLSISVGGKWQATGKGYLFWSMGQSGKVERGNFKPARWYFPPGTTFRVTLATRGPDTACLEQATTAFWLLTQFGGLGSRSRRCAGSLAVDKVEGQTVTSLPFTTASDAEALKEALEKGLKQARNLTRAVLEKLEGKPFKPTAPSQTPFDVLAPQVCRIVILQDDQPWSSAEAAMTDLGEDLQDYRSHIDIHRRTIFGLPLPPMIFNQRRASPLLLRIVELQGKRYVGLAVVFQTSGKGVTMADYKLINDWLDGFRGKREVSL